MVLVRGTVVCGGGCNGLRRYMDMMALFQVVCILIDFPLMTIPKSDLCSLFVFLIFLL